MPRKRTVQIEFGYFSAVLAVCLSNSAIAIENATVVRVDEGHVRVSWTDEDPVTIYVVDRPGVPAKAATPVVAADLDSEALIESLRGQRHYIAIRDGGDGSFFLTAEREVPLERGSNFRDIGGYVGEGGKRVVWGRIYRSGAVPMLTENDYSLLGGLGLTTIVDLRSLEERSIAPDQVDDRTGALFLSNDYSIAPMLASMRPEPGKVMYAGAEQTLVPQFRALFRRLLVHDGATMYHCSAGQDRTGIATALILSALGVDRQTILTDYHLSTALRRPQNEMPRLDPAEYPGNPIAALYAASQAKPDAMKADPLFTPDGKSHLAMFLDYLDQKYGGVEGYLSSQLGIGPADIHKLRQLYLQ